MNEKSEQEQKMGLKTAVCLVVKNEEIEIIYWMAWYKALGFDAFIIYDDSSEDNTENNILSLSGVLDIRYSRMLNNRNPHTERQLSAYNDAVLKYGNEFDWIALFDCDEYLDLYGLSIKDYLLKYEAASLIAFNWCCVGSNGYISRPPGNPIFNYRRHGHEDLFWNKHTKVIFKPKYLSKEIYSVHNVPVSGKSLRSDGSLVEWESPHGGLCAPPPNWSGGRLYHFQSRSLEHYVKRDKKLEDWRRDKNNPLHEVTNNNKYSEIEFYISDTYLRLYNETLKDIIYNQSFTIKKKLGDAVMLQIKMISDLFRENRVNIFDPTHKMFRNCCDFTSSFVYKNRRREKEYCIFQLEDHFGHIVSWNNKIVYAIHVKNMNIMYFVLDDGEFFSLGRDPRYLPVLAYNVWTHNDEKYSFSHPTNDTFLGALPEYTYTYTRITPLAWEKFTIINTDDSCITEYIHKIAKNMCRIYSLGSLKMSCNTHDFDPLLIVSAINMLDKTEIQAIKCLLRGGFHESLF
ncbi:MAG: glycosyltransferase family 2 protein [Acetobacter sp.]|nr:glycosyltransferase family 2 protein [Acetobacter sp.]MCI1320684.1 glycosyltransferase family 2 protein [Acetobacter sp.]MCI1373984.1 glycosyltransferase family 2 protein [Acetobacter sp.]MCI1414461.1 glycosyltransferase family 2 protein [Acetobacter sp.]MCI1442414.1 glycosyltransferase family 2 protein [Acetobacter sp.]